jgi:hypothetical protein
MRTRHAERSRNRSAQRTSGVARIRLWRLWQHAKRHASARQCSFAGPCVLERACAFSRVTNGERFAELQGTSQGEKRERAGEMSHGLSCDPSFHPMPLWRRQSCASRARGRRSGDAGCSQTRLPLIGNDGGCLGNAILDGRQGRQRLQPWPQGFKRLFLIALPWRRYARARRVVNVLY